ncbi:hypothetical protein CAQU_11595 [Corynebacterium aquilae DSM 44791]|uniref:Secreted protein n=1 Tax=Corynebacterium aquilae DSM 44791 TaxID=1431546 RepID=A0A1L7CI98_9CORY|nr:hypothetical protein CAQU_11595 [Corynebacterium aquilae DSM 44791]
MFSLPFFLASCFVATSLAVYACTNAEVLEPVIIMLVPDRMAAFLFRTYKSGKAGSMRVLQHWVFQA